MTRRGTGPGAAAAGVPRLLAVLALAVLGAAACTPGAAQPPPQRQLVVLAAASLTGVLDELAGVYEAEHAGTTVLVSTGGSSALVQQVVNGSPADLLAVASVETADQVVEAGAAAGEPVLFTSNRLQIAVPAGNPAGVAGLADLGRPELTVAVCAVQVPCGAVAQRAFTSSGLRAAPDTLERDVKAVLAKVRLGEVDAGLVYATDVLAAGREVQGIDLPVGATASTDYAAVLLEAGDQKAAAQQFLDLLLSPAGQAVLARAGFAGLPCGTPPPCTAAPSPAAP